MNYNPLRVEDLPPPPAGRTGFPWTAGTRALPATLPGGKDYPKISIVTPSYQQGHYLEETIRSVLLQGYPNLEYLVMDGGSQDNSLEIIHKYAPFLTSWANERDTGQANAINKGFARSTGDVLGWLNSDDILLPGALYRIARVFIQKPQTQLVTGFRKMLDEESRVTSNFIRDIPSNYYLRHYCGIAQETTYWRRQVWEELGALDETLQFAMDYEFWLRAIHKGYSFYLIPHYIGGFRDYAENKTNSWGDTYLRDMKVLYRRYEMGEDELEVHTRLGQRWADRYPLYLRISRQAWTNYPRLVQLAWRILETPLLCDSLLVIWRFNKSYLNFRKAAHRSIPAAVIFALSEVTRYSVQPTTADLRLATGRNEWGNIRTIPDRSQINDEAALSALPADSLAFGTGWYSTEFHQGDYFRWCSGNGEIQSINASAHWTHLKVVAAPAVISSENKLELVDENERLIASVVADAPRIEFTAALPETEGACVRYRLRWRGSTAGEDQYEKRRLAFRLLRIGRQGATPPLEIDLEFYEDAVDRLLVKSPVEKLPVIGAFATVMLGWYNAFGVMAQELALWRQVAESLSVSESKRHSDDAVSSSSQQRDTE